MKKKIIMKKLNRACPHVRPKSKDSSLLPLNKLITAKEKEKENTTLYILDFTGGGKE